MPNERTGYGRFGWWHPDGYVIYADGDTSAWPEDLVDHEVPGLKYSPGLDWWYLAYDQDRAHGHLYYDPERGGLVNSVTGELHGQWANDYVITYELVREGSGGRHSFYRVVCTPGPDFDENVGFDYT